MPSKPPVGVSTETLDPEVECLIESEVQASRDAFTLTISHFLVWASSVISIMLLGLWFLTPAYPQILIYAVLVLLLALGGGLYPIFQRRNRTTTGLFFVYSPFLAVIILSPLLIPSLMPADVVVDIIAMMVTIMLLGERRSRWLVGVLAFAYLMDVVMVSILEWSLFPPLAHSLEIWITSIVSLSAMLIAIMSIRLIVLGQGNQFRRAQRLNLELESRIQAGNEIQTRLNYERNLLRTLIDTVPANVYIKDAQSCFVDANLETTLELGAKVPMS